MYLIRFDLGCRKDYWNHPPAISQRLGDVIPGLRVSRNTSEILEEKGIPLNSITSVIWSHYHWDHTGDVSLFPPTTSLIVGPDFHSKLPGYPTNAKSPINESDFAGRELISLAFDTDLHIGRFSAHDLFGDGSFYLLDSPGHCVGHICGLARVTPTSFVFMGGDICHVVLVVVFGFCLWQNHELLHILNKPLQTQTKKQVAKGQGTVGQAVLAQQSLLKLSGDTQAAMRALQKPDSGISAQARAELPALIAAMKADVAKIPRKPVGDNPVTLGVGEPFTTTITVSLLFAMVISLPLILYEIYGFILPALSPMRNASRGRCWLPSRSCSPSAWRSATSSCCPPQCASS